MTVVVMLLLDIADRRVTWFRWVVGTTHTAVKVVPATKDHELSVYLGDLAA
jgi:hypothetical protein